MVDDSILKQHFSFDTADSKLPQFNSDFAKKYNNDILLHYGQIQISSKACSTWLSPSNICDQNISVDELGKQLASCKEPEAIVNVLTALNGAWALVYYRHNLKKIFVGRDVFGRKSLLWSRSGETISMSPKITDFEVSWFDLPSGVVTVLDASSFWSHPTVYSARGVINTEWIKQFVEPNFVPLSELTAKRLTTSELSLGHEVAEAEVSEVVDKMLVNICGAVSRNVGDVTEPSICLLFSGGVDSLLLAHTLHTCLSPSCSIDLINVSFDKSQDFSGAPDRLRSIEAFEHLRSCYHDRTFRLILVDVQRDELKECRERHIARLVLPSNSVLDDSIACVLWFAARAQGRLYNQSDGPSITVKCESKRVLVGSGADELFGGYSRHRSSFERGGRLAAIHEMEQELSRIGERNLGRDDRVISSLGKDALAPFLDDTFVEWVNGLPLELKADFSKERGVGEKVLIRLALKKLGAAESLYAAPKRAMQFGTRIAKLEQRKEKGSDRCSRLNKPHNAYVQS